VRVAALAVITLALFYQPEDTDVPDVAPASDFGMSVFVLLAVSIAAIFAFDVLRTWWQTNEWRRELRRPRR
jgi:hypothetical protein